MSDPRDIDTEEIEVTPEMIEAAEGWLYSFDPERGDADDCLRNIFLAMTRAMRHTTSDKV